MLTYREITSQDDIEKFAEFNIDTADAFYPDRPAFIEQTLEEFSRSRCIGIYDENGSLAGSIVLIFTPPYVIEIVPKEQAEVFYTQENITAEDCVQLLYAVLPNASANERLAFYRRNLEEMINAGKEHILIFYTDDKHNRHKLYQRMKPEVIAQKEYPGYTKRLVFVRRSNLLAELERVEKQIALRQAEKALEHSF